MRHSFVAILLILIQSTSSFTLNIPPFLATTIAAPPKPPSSAATTTLSPEISLDNVSSVPLPERVAVAGATGRTGRLVVAELLKRNVNVVALIRDDAKAKETLPVDVDDEESGAAKLTIVKCDLGSEKEIASAVKGCDAAVWCATGFSDAESTLVAKIKGFFGVIFPARSIDITGLPALAASLASEKTEGVEVCPKVVLLSSAGVTRPSWSEEKKEKYKGCADIPIVRLNPFGILDTKVASEETLRQSGVDYCIVRPCGLNDKWPTNSRPIFSQGDIGVGRINRADVATLLVDTLTQPAATGKTFEVITLAGYPPAVDLSVALQRLRRDDGAAIPEEVLENTYAMMQQLLPGERQDAASLAMGQTYEELDRGVTGRLGERGTEDAEAAAPKPSS